MSRASARVLWYAPFYVSALLTAINAMAQLVRGNYINAVTAAFLALVFVMWCGQCRREFHRGWDRGFQEGYRLPQEARQGQVPDSVVRAITTGDMAPEPWDVLRRYRTDDDTADSKE